MNTKSYYILIVILSVAAGGAAFYFLKPHGELVPQNLKLSGETLKDLTGSGVKPQDAGSTPKTKATTGDPIDANAKVNSDLTSSFKAIEAALASGERSFSAMQQIYENSDYKNFFSPADPSLRLSAEQGRAKAEDSFLYARSALMAAEDNAKANIDASFAKTAAFLDDISVALQNTKLALGKSAADASVSQSQFDGFKNAVVGSVNDILSAKTALTSAKSKLDADRADPAYQFYLKNAVEKTIVQ